MWFMTNIHPSFISNLFVNISSILLPTHSCDMDSAISYPKQDVHLGHVIHDKCPKLFEKGALQGFGKNDSPTKKLQDNIAL